MCGANGKKGGAALCKLSSTSVYHIGFIESRQPEKPQQGMTQRVIITKSSPIINLAAKRGYTYSEIADILAEEGISNKAATLKQYSAESTKSKLRCTRTEPDRRSRNTNRSYLARNSSPQRLS